MLAPLSPVGRRSWGKGTGNVGRNGGGSHRVPNPGAQRVLPSMRHPRAMTTESQPKRSQMMERLLGQEPVWFERTCHVGRAGTENPAGKAYNGPEKVV